MICSFTTTVIISPNNTHTSWIPTRRTMYTALCRPSQSDLTLLSPQPNYAKSAVIIIKVKLQCSKHPHNDRQHGKDGVLPRRPVLLGPVAQFAARVEVEHVSRAVQGVLDRLEHGAAPVAEHCGLLELDDDSLVLGRHAGDLGNADQDVLHGITLRVVRGLVVLQGPLRDEPVGVAQRDDEDGAGCEGFEVVVHVVQELPEPLEGPRVHLVPLLLR